MNQEDLGKIIVFGFLIVIGLIILKSPVEGTIFGETFTLPVIGWIAFGAFAVMAIYLFFKHRA